MEAVNELTENLTFAPTSRSYTLARNNERESGREKGEVQGNSLQQKTYWAVKGFFRVVCLIGTAV